MGKNDKFDCACGGKYTRQHRNGHKNTLKHQNYLCDGILKNSFDESYYNAIREEPIKCICGSQYQPNNQNKHFNTKKHKKYLNELQEI